MILYSKKIIQFVNELTAAVKNIISFEVRLAVKGDRFYDRRRTSSYPIKVVIFNNQSMLGYFDANFYELGFHECLMRCSREKLQNILRHEIAHYMTFINFESNVEPHGAEFREFCLRRGWGEEVYRARCCLDGAEEASSSEESAILRKVKKLMALSTSSNTHEAEMAMIKSQQLLLKHHIDEKDLESRDESTMVLRRILKKKKKDAKMTCIARILSTFFVHCVYNRGGEHVYLEIVGSALNVEIAEYVASFLQSELDRLLSHVRYTHKTVAKNSFFLGLAKGYCDKIQALKRQYPSNALGALMVIEKQLSDTCAIVYPRLSYSRSNAQYCPQSSLLGESMGRKLSINPAVKGETSCRKMIGAL